MSEEKPTIKLAADNVVRRHYHTLTGLSIAVTAMGGDKPKSTLPGFGYAMALVEKEWAEARSDYARAVYRCAAKAGHDVSNIGALISTVENGKLVLEIRPSDLVDQAEADEE